LTVPPIDATCKAHGYAQTISAYLNHAANVMIAVCLCWIGAAVVSSVKVGGVNATLVQNVANSNTKNAIYAIPRSAAANELVEVTLNASNSQTFVAISFTDADQDVSTAFEGTTTATSTTTYITSTVAAGTTDRRVIMSLSVTGNVTVTPGSGQTMIDEDAAGTGGSDAKIHVNYEDNSAETVMDANLSTNPFSCCVSTALLPKGHFTVTDSAAGSDAVTIGQTLTDAAAGTDSVSIGIPVTDSAAGSETVTIGLPITDSAKAIDVVYRVRNETSLDGAELPHVSAINVEEPSVVQDLPVMDALPYRKQVGKEGRSVKIQGWTDSLTTLEILRGYADGEKHLFLLPTGDSMNVHVTDVRTPENVETYDRYDYEMDAVEVID